MEDPRVCGREAVDCTHSGGLKRITAAAAAASDDGGSLGGSSGSGSGEPRFGKRLI